MLELLSHLHGPELVARFQRRCGLFLVEPARHGRGTAAAAATTTRAPPEEATVHADRPRAQLQGRWDHRDNNSNYKYEEDGCGVGVSRKQIGPSLGLCRWIELQLENSAFLSSRLCMQSKGWLAFPVCLSPPPHLHLQVVLDVYIVQVERQPGYFLVALFTIHPMIMSTENLHVHCFTYDNLQNAIWI